MMKEKEQQFLDEVCAEIKAKTTHPEIRQELASHLEDLICDREAMGDTRDEAVSWAIIQMGNPKTLGRELHQIHKPRVPWGLFGVIILLSAFSLIGMSSVDIGYGNYTGYGFLNNTFQRQSMNILIGIVLMLGMYFIDFRKLKGLSWFLYGFSLVGIIMSLVWGIKVNGVNYNLVFFSSQLDFTSYRPYVLIIAIAGILLNRRDVVQLRTWRSGLFDLSIILIPALLLMGIRSFPELVVYLLSSLALYGWVTRDWLKSVVILGFSIIAGLALISTNVLLMDRIIGAVNPFGQDKNGYTYRIIHEVISSAGWWGHGFGSTSQELPYVYTDLFPVYLIHCFGWAGGLLLLCVILWFFVKLLSTVRVIREPYGRALVVGMTLLLAIRLGYGLSVLSGRMLLTSIPFPFLSYGSHVFIEYAAIGLLMGIYRRKDIIGTQTVVN